MAALLAALAACDAEGPELESATDAAVADVEHDAASHDVPPVPSATWVWRVWNPLLREYANVVLERSDGGALLAGFVEDDEPQGRAWVAAFGPDAALRWARRLPPSVAWLSAGAPDPGGGALLAGTWSAELGGDGLLLRLRDDGTVRSARTLRLPGSSRVAALSAAPDGGWLVAGGVSVDGSAEQAFVARLEPDGTPRWAVHLPELADAQRGGVAATVDGGAVLASAGDTGAFVHLVRLEANGASRWQRGVAGAVSLGPYPSVAVAADGDVALAYPDAEDIVVVRFADDGSLRWRARVGGAAYERGGPLVGTPDGGLIVGGTRESPGETTFDTWLAALDPAGGLAWERTVAGDRLEEVHDLRLTSDGGVLATAGGCCTSIVLRLALDGSFDGSCDVLQPTDAVSEVDTIWFAEETPRVEPLEPLVRDVAVVPAPDEWTALALCE